MPTPIYSETNKVSLAISQETTWAQAPGTPAMAPLRYTSETMTPQKKTTVSTIIRSDRQRAFLAEVQASAGGDIAFEYSFGGLDLIVESAFMNTFSIVAIAASAITAVAAVAGVAQLTQATGSFVTSGVKVGMWIKPKGFTHTANNVPWQVTAVTALAISVADAGNAMVAEVGTAVTVEAKSLANGTSLISFLLEAQYTDISQFIQFPGCAVDTLTFDIKTGAIVTLKSKIMAQQGLLSTATVAASLSAVDTTQVLTATANAGNLYENGVALTTALKALTFEINNNMREKPAIGQLYSVGLGLGFCDVTGTFEAYFADQTQMTQFINHTNASLSFQFKDAAGNVIVITLFNMYLTKAEPTVQGGNQDVMVQCGFQAILDPVSQHTVQIDYLAA